MENHQVHEELNLITYHNYVLSSQMGVERFFHHPNQWDAGPAETSDTDFYGEYNLNICFVMEINEQT